jgi:hypothetical protein
MAHALSGASAGSAHLAPQTQGLISPAGVDGPPLASFGPADDQGIVSLADMEREHILTALRATNWVLGGPQGAAVRLAMKRTTLQSKMKKLGIPNRPQATRAARSARQHPLTAVTNVWSRNGKPIVTDGPFAETHELLGR